MSIKLDGVDRVMNVIGNIIVRLELTFTQVTSKEKEKMVVYALQRSKTRLRLEWSDETSCRS